jgi:hypothetical protein
MIQFILLALFYAGLAYLGVGLIGLAFLSRREEKNWLKNEAVQRLLPGKVKPEIGPLIDEIVPEHRDRMSWPGTSFDDAGDSEDQAAEQAVKAARQPSFLQLLLEPNVLGHLLHHGALDMRFIVTERRISSLFLF